MRILANENFPKASVVYLREKGFDVISIGDDFAGITDDEIIHLANQHERIILTFDRDYGELIFKKGVKPRGGFVYLRLDDFTPEEPGRMIESLVQLENIHFHETFTVLDREGIRQRKY